MCGRTRGQAPLCPHRRPPRPRYSVVGVCRRGGLHFGRHTAQNLDITASKRGNCTNRATTRRRHAAGRLLMPQNPHRQPDIHPGAEGGGAESTGALRDMGLATAPAGGDPTTSRQISHVISPRSLFETTRKRCNSNDVDSTFELIAGELRATFMGGGRAWPSFETTRRRHADRMLLMLQNPHHDPWRHAPSLAPCTLTSAGQPGGAPINACRASPTGPAAQARVGQAQINACRASPPEPGQGNDRPAPRRRMLPIRRNTPSVISQPVLIGRNALDQVESRLTGRMPR